MKNTQRALSFAVLFKLCTARVLVQLRVGSDPVSRIFCTYVLDIRFIDYVLRMGSTRLFESYSLIGSQILLRVPQGIGGKKNRIKNFKF